MNRMLIVVGLILICVIGLGFYFEFFRIGSESSDGATHFTFTVDQRKIQGSGKEALENVQGRE